MSNLINLDSEEFDSKVAKIFNNGEAGRSKCILHSVVAKTSEDKDNAPDYKVVFADPSGATINISFWELSDTNAQYYQENLKRDGKKLKHILHTLYGKSFKIPPANTAVELLKNSMSLINAKVGTALNIMTVYGTDSRPSSFLNIRSFPPFMEIASVSEEESLLKFTGFELKHKPEGTSTALASNESTGSVNWEEED